jgi:hypothetical protein
MLIGHRTRFRALAAVCIFATSLAVAACSSAASARPVSPGFTGYDWQVVAISHGGKVTSIPARWRVALQFSPGGQFGANDSVNFHSGTYRAGSTGASLKELMARLGHSSTRGAMIYQHATRDRDQAIAKALGGLVEQVRLTTAKGPEEASGDA